MQRTVAGPPGSEACSAAPARPSAPAIKLELRRASRQCNAKLETGPAGSPSCALHPLQAVARPAGSTIGM